MKLTNASIRVNSRHNFSTMKTGQQEVIILFYTAYFRCSTNLDIYISLYSKPPVLYRKATFIMFSPYRGGNGQQIIDFHQPALR